MKKTILISLVIALAFLFSCKYKNATVTDSDTAQSNNKNNLVNKPLKKFNWEYSEDINQMTSKKDFFAKTYSTNLLNFQPPYDGSQNAMLFLRYKGVENDVTLSIEKGQFYVYGGSLEDGNSGTIKIRFDDGKAKEYEYSTPSDGGTDMIFIHPAKAIINKMKKSKIMFIQVSFYNEGSQILNFNVDSLKWDH